MLPTISIRKKMRELILMIPDLPRLVLPPAVKYCRYFTLAYTRTFKVKNVVCLIPVSERKFPLCWHIQKPI